MRFAIRTLLGVIIAYVVMTAANVAFHWYIATQDTTTAHWLREWYLYVTPGTQKHHSAYADNFIPTIVLALAIGAITAGRSKREMMWYLFIFPLGIAALIPVYAGFFPSHWWWSITDFEKATVLIVIYAWTLLLGGFMVCIGRALSLYFQGRQSDVEEDL